MEQLIRKMIVKRELASYSAIKKIYLYEKFKTVIKGLMKLIQILEYKNLDEKQHFMNLMKDQFIDNNPWFKKVIHIMGILSAPNE